MIRLCSFCHVLFPVSNCTHHRHKVVHQTTQQRALHAQQHAVAGDCDLHAAQISRRRGHPDGAVPRGIRLDRFEQRGVFEQQAPVPEGLHRAQRAVDARLHLRMQRARIISAKGKRSSEALLWAAHACRNMYGGDWHAAGMCRGKQGTHAVSRIAHAYTLPRSAGGRAGTSQERTADTHPRRQALLHVGLQATQVERLQHAVRRLQRGLIHPGRSRIGQVSTLAADPAACSSWHRGSSGKTTGTPAAGCQIRAGNHAKAPLAILQSEVNPLKACIAGCVLLWQDGRAWLPTCAW